MKLFHRFFQVGFPEDGNILSLRLPPRWNNSELKLRKLNSAQEGSTRLSFSQNRTKNDENLLLKEPCLPIPEIPTSSTLPETVVDVQNSSAAQDAARFHHTLVVPPPLPPRSPLSLVSMTKNVSVKESLLASQEEFYPPSELSVDTGFSIQKIPGAISFDSVHPNQELAAEETLSSPESSIRASEASFPLEKHSIGSISGTSADGQVDPLDPLLHTFDPSDAKSTSSSPGAELSSNVSAPIEDHYLDESTITHSTPSDSLTHRPPLQNDNAEFVVQHTESEKTNLPSELFLKNSLSSAQCNRDDPSSSSTLEPFKMESPIKNSPTVSPPPLNSELKIASVFVEKKSPHPVEYYYTPTIIDSFPNNVTENIAMQNISMFCFPDNMKIIESASGPPPITNHSFVLTNEDGSKLHCMCLIFWEKPSPPLLANLQSQCNAWRHTNLNPADMEYLTHLREQIHEQRTKLLKPSDEDVDAIKEKLRLFTDLLQPFAQSAFVEIEHFWIPRALCFSSPWPIYDIMQDYLKCLYSGILNFNGTRIPLEACLVNLFYELPFPPPGRKEIAIQAHSHNIYFSRPAPNEISSLKNFSLHPLFRSFEIADILLLMECILNEKKLLFLSEYPSMLNSCIQSLLILLFPFNWFHVLIPVLPVGLISYLEAPVPFIMGMLKAHLSLCEELVTDIVLCDLDGSSVHCPDGVLRKLLPIPPRHRTKLLTRLKKACRLPVTGAPMNMREAFPLGHMDLHCRSIVSLRDLGCAKVLSATIPPSPSSLNALATTPTISAQTSFATLPSLDNATVPITPSPTSTSSTKFSFRHLPGKSSYSPVKSSVEGHTFLETPAPVKDACFFCDNTAHAVYKCAGCSLTVHSACFPFILEWCPRAFQEPSIRMAFLKVFVGLLKNYRAYMTSKIFDTTFFLAEVQPETKDFLTMFLDTQAFSQFLQDRLGNEDSSADYEVIFFDEMVKAKNSRTILPFNKLSGSTEKEFFSDRSFEVKSTHVCLAPEPINESVQVYSRFPFTSSEVLAKLSPRPPPSLVTPHEEIMLALYTAKISRQAKRNAKSWNTTPTWKTFKFTDPAPELEQPLYHYQVDEYIRLAWDTLNDPKLQTPIHSRQDFHQRQKRFIDIKDVLQSMSKETCEPSDLEDVQLIVRQIDKWLKHLEDDFHQTFLDDKALSGSQPVPTLSVFIPDAGIDFPQRQGI